MITIIILLILVGISISALTGNGLFGRAKESNEKTQEAQIKEKINLAIQEITIEELGDNSLEKIKEKLPIKLDGLMAEIEENKIFGEYNEYEYIIDDGLNISVQKATGIKIEYSLSTTDYTNNDITLIINSKSTNGEIKSIQKPESITKNNDNTYNISQNGSYEFIVTDVKDETKKIIIEINNIDKDIPVIESVTPEENTAVLKASDTGLGIVGYAVTQSNQQPESFTDCDVTNSLEITINNLVSSTSYYVWVKDKAGNVSEAKQFETIAHRTYIYNYGDQCTEFTGGIIALKNRSDSIVEFREDVIYCDSVDGNKGTVSFFTNNKINLTEYSKLNCLIDVTKSYGYLPRLGMYSSNTQASAGINSISNYVTATSLGRQILIKDISQITQEVYIKLAQCATGYIYQIWLE